MRIEEERIEKQREGLLINTPWPASGLARNAEAALLRERTIYHYKADRRDRLQKSLQPLIVVFRSIPPRPPTLTHVSTGCFRYVTLALEKMYPTFIARA